SSTTAEIVDDRRGQSPVIPSTSSTEANRVTEKPVSNLTGTYLIPVHLTRPSEPILFTKLRIQFADLPYLHVYPYSRFFRYLLRGTIFMIRNEVGK
ncbi:uncharacterized protein DEA37_0009046, partial [Paragonimus westermani]